MSVWLLVILGLSSLLAVGLQRTYSQISLRELKIRAREGDKISSDLIKAVGYGRSLQILLWLWVVISSAGFFVAVSRYTNAWAAVSISAFLIAVGFVWLPSTPGSPVGKFIAAKLSPVLAFLMNYLHPLADKLTSIAKFLRPENKHTGLYDKSDIIDLLKKQQAQSDSRVEKAELEIASNVIKLGDINVSERMTVWRQAKTVSPEDSLGPVLMDELHSSGQTSFPVYDENQKAVVGTLFLRDLVKVKTGGKVADLMKPEVYYLHEDQTISDALQAVLKTHRHIFIVVNSEADHVGTITSHEIFEAVMGNALIDEFDQYDDIRAVIDRAVNKLPEELELSETETEESVASEAGDLNETAAETVQNEPDLVETLPSEDE